MLGRLCCALLLSTVLVVACYVAGVYTYIAALIMLKHTK